MVKRILAFVMVIVLLGIPVTVNAQTYPSKYEVNTMVKKNLMAHKSEFTIKMSVKTMNELKGKNFMHNIFNMDDKSTSKDFDYLKLNIDSWKESWKWSNVTGAATLTVTAKYATSLKQEEEVDKKLASILKSLNLKGKTDYQKAKAIHDYVIKLVNYDTTLKKHTAYHALIQKSVVCEGYSLVAYRLFTDAGLQSRIITGTADGGPHSWNIVKINGKWYNIDLTWDDPITSNGKSIVRYDYFLKNNKEFKDHTRDAEFKTAAFNKAYPMAASSYKK